MSESISKYLRLHQSTIRDKGGYNTTFTFGPSCRTLTPLLDLSWITSNGPGKADWSYTIELRDTGDFGFVLPPEHIRGAAEERWAGVQVILSLLDEVFFDGEGPASKKEQRLGDWAIDLSCLRPG